MFTGFIVPPCEPILLNQKVKTEIQKARNAPPPQIDIMLVLQGRKAQAKVAHPT